MPAACEPILRRVLRDESLTRGLGDEEARLLMEWLAEWTELLAGAARTDDDAWMMTQRLCRRGKAIGRFVQLWGNPRERGAAAQLAASERFRWPLPYANSDPADLMQEILHWENQHPNEEDD